VALADHLAVSALFPLSLENYHRLVEAGGFEGERVELIDGMLVRMSPKSEAHERATEYLTDWLGASIQRPRYIVGSQRGLTIGQSEPEPDVTVRERDEAGPYHPSTAVLVIEVAVSSLMYDLAVKARIYASAGIPEYWVVDVSGRRVVVHRSPGADAYAERFDVAADGVLTATALPLPDLRVADVLAAAGY
jgi:Uma2 family endonuclease